jgi:site-specific recombinase XerD
MKISQAIEALAAYNQGQMKSPETVQFYTGRLVQFARFVGPDGQLEDVKREDVRAFMATLPARYTPETARGTMVAVKRLFNFACSEGIMSASPIATLPLPSNRRTERPALQPEQAGAVLAAFRDTRAGRKFRAMSLLAIDTGLRVGELVALNLADIDAERILVRQGKGAKPRVVFMGFRAQEAIERYVTKDRPVPAPGHEQALWLTSSGERIRTATYRKALYQAGDRARIHVHPHMLRRTFATLMVRHGGDVFALQELMGHASVSTTRRYVVADESRLREVHRKTGPGDLL